jgi:hypothetical protein
VKYVYHNRKMTMITVFLAVIFILVICSSLFISCNAVSPIYMDTVFKKHSEFENFENNTMNEYAKHLIVPQENGCKKVHGMNGLFCAPSNEADNLDKFADAEGKLDCKDNSGLSNSRGGLCLTEQHKRLLSTRGGNSAPSNVTDAGDKKE